MCQRSRRIAPFGDQLLQRRLPAPLAHACAAWRAIRRRASWRGRPGAPDNGVRPWRQRADRRVDDPHAKSHVEHVLAATTQSRRACSSINGRSHSIMTPSLASSKSVSPSYCTLRERYSSLSAALAAACRCAAPSKFCTHSSIHERIYNVLMACVEGMVRTTAASINCIPWCASNKQLVNAFIMPTCCSNHQS